MESPSSLARYVSQDSKKSVFPGGSSIAAQVEEVSPSISRISKSESAKQEEPIHHGVINVDMEGSNDDVMLIDGNTESSGKGKETFLELSLGQGGSANSVGASQVQSLKKHFSSESDDVPADLFHEDDVPTDMYFDDPVHNNYAMLQSHFDLMDIPSGVEVPIPWMFGPAEAKMESTSTTTSSTSKAPGFPFGRETPELLKNQSTLWYGLTPVNKPTQFELSSSSLGAAFDKREFSANGNSKETSSKEQNGSTNLSPGAEKSFEVQGSHKLHLSQGTASDSGHTQSIPGASYFPTVHFVPPPMPGWMNLPLNMTTAQASSGFMLTPGAMNPIPLKQVHPGVILAPGAMNPIPLKQVHPGVILAPGAMNPIPLKQVHPGVILSPGVMNPIPLKPVHPGVMLTPGDMNPIPLKQVHPVFMLPPGDMNPIPLKPVHPAFMLAPGDMNSPPLGQVHPGCILTPDAMSYSSGPVLPPDPMHYFHQQMGHALWMHGLHNSAATTGSPPPCDSAFSEEQHRDLGESLKNFRLFKKFDTVQDHSDHYFSKLASHGNQASKSCAKRIQEEWKILEKDLPDTIFVRVYETRMDLLRAVIIGADGTPYHDGLFFFDVFFPSNYPDVPPLVHYHSYGLRINPNLYDCGKVCLSLLNTWDGKGKEKWIPGESTMLQVLVSIQGLILNAKPYFNEPGYDKLSGYVIGEQSSMQYNENTFIFNLKTMVYCMRRPPQNFEDFVIGHYFQSSKDILAACKAYTEGARVGSLVRGCLLDDGGEGDKGCSENFKAVLAGFIKTLVDTFTKIGAKDCDMFLPLAEKASTEVAPVKAEQI